VSGEGGSIWMLWVGWSKKCGKADYLVIMVLNRDMTATVMSIYSFGGRFVICGTNNCCYLLQLIHSRSAVFHSCYSLSYPSSLAKVD